MRRHTMACVLAGALANVAIAQDASPPPPVNETETLRAELKETKDRLRAFEAENESLKRQHELTKQSLATLTQTLAEANAEAEVFRRQCSELKLRMEALGLESVGDDKEALEQRLLKSVRDLALVREEKDALGEHLVALAEAIFRYLKTAPGAGDPATRLDVEAQLRAANQAMTAGSQGEAGSSQSATLMSGQVISVKQEWSLVVANVGSKQGVRLGMPFRVVRGDKLIAEVRAIDVRERITGAVIEEVRSSDTEIKVGDTLTVDTQF